VETLSLTGLAAVPGDAKLLVFASPKLDLFPQEIDVLNDYMKMSGGNVLFMFDYDEYAADMDNFNRVLADNGNVMINNDKVRSEDENTHMPGDPYTILYSSGRNAVFTEPLQVVLNNSRSVTRLMNTKEWLTLTSLLSTSEQAVSEPVSASQEERPGPLDIAVSVENAGGMKVSKMVVIGNGTFISDSAYNLYGAQLYQFSSRMFLYTLRWMLGDDDKLTIEPKVQRSTVLTITESQTRVISLFLIVGLPLIIMGSGFAVYLRRRHL